MQIQVTIQSNHKLSAYRDRKPRTRQEEQNRAEQSRTGLAEKKQSRTDTNKNRSGANVYAVCP